MTCTKDHLNLCWGSDENIKQCGNTRKGILGIFPFNHIAHQWQVSYHFFWFHLIILPGSPWFNQTDKNSLECVVELQRTGCYSRWDHHVQAISSLSLHITFLPPQPPLPTPMILPTPTHHKATKPEMTATVHEHATPLQNHSHMWPHKHWATSPLITWQPYSADWWEIMTDSSIFVGERQNSALEHWKFHWDQG